MEATWLIENEILTEDNYYALQKRKQIQVVRRACRNTPALVAYHSVPQRFQKKIKDIMGGDPSELVSKGPVSRKITTDYKAYEFFSNYRYADGQPIPTNKQDNILLWSNNASILNTLKLEWEMHVKARAAHGRKPMSAEFYRNALTLVTDATVNKQFPNNLPTNERRLQDKLEAYMKYGYECLVKHYKGNQNAKKVTSDLEKLILALYAMPNKPYMATVHEMYTLFLSGGQSIIDQGTGEIFSPEDFRKKDGTPIKISESTINNYINKPSNRVIIDRLRNDAKHWNDTHAPHHHRLQPTFSLSKVSMDDRDLPNSETKAYYCYDIASGCIIGKAYSLKKDTDLIVDCLRDMFAFIDSNNLAVPMEVEVEHHLMNTLTDTIMKEGSLFRYIRWCNPGNSQEKWAETGNRLKKYGTEKKYQEGIGRFYSRNEANRPKQVGEWDENGMRIKERKRSFEQAVADDLFSIEKYNNEIHPKYDGKTRLQVLAENVNPACMKLPAHVVARQIGDHTTTSIRRNQSLTVQYRKYVLPALNVLDMLKPNNYTVDAYYLVQTGGEINEIHLYQEDVFICTCQPLVMYNTARAEQTEADHEAYTEQAKYVSQFRKKVKDGKNGIPKLLVTENDTPVYSDLKADVFIPKTIEPEKTENTDDDLFENALNDF